MATASVRRPKMGPRYAYHDIVSLFQSKGCRVLSTEADFLAQYTPDKQDNTDSTGGTRRAPKRWVRIVAQCGHVVPKCIIETFHARGTGQSCADCRRREVAAKSRQRHASFSTRHVFHNCETFHTEYKGICVIQDALSRFGLSTARLSEGALADIAVRPCGLDADEWLPVQVKVTKQPREGIVSFHISNKYRDMPIVFVCLNPERTWVIDGNKLLHQSWISIGVKSSRKYPDAAQTDAQHLAQTLRQMYDQGHRLSLEDTKRPIAAACKTEMVFATLREEKASPCANFYSYPDINNGVTDFTVNGLRVQEKVAQFVSPGTRGGRLVVWLRKRGGTTSRKPSPYAQGDNAFYWIHHPDKSGFFLLPEQVLLDRGYVGRRSGTLHLPNPSQRLSRAPTTPHWALPFFFSYQDVDTPERLRLSFFF